MNTSNRFITLILIAFVALLAPVSACWADLGDAQLRALALPEFVRTIKALAPRPVNATNPTYPPAHPYIQRAGLNSVLLGIANKDDSLVAAGARELALPFTSDTLKLTRFADSMAFFGAWARALALLQTVKHKEAAALASHSSAVRARLADKGFLDDMKQWQAGSKGNALQANQLLWAALDAQSLGEALRDTDWKKRAASWQARALAVQDPDGLFVDARAKTKEQSRSYQAASMDRLLWIVLGQDRATQNPTHTRAQNNAITSGMTWLASKLQTACTSQDAAVRKRAAAQQFAGVFALWRLAGEMKSDVAGKLSATVQAQCADAGS